MRAGIYFLVLILCCSGTVYAAKGVKYYYKMAEKYIDKGKYDKAIELCKQALQVDPNMPQLYNLIGIAYMKQQKSVESAIGSFEEAIRIDPHYIDGYYNLAITYAGMGDQTDLAVQYFNKALEVNPGYAKAYLGLGWLMLFQKREPEKAVELFQKAIDLKAQQPEAHFGLGMAYITMGKRERSLKPISYLRSMNRYDLASTLESLMVDKVQQSETPSQSTEQTKPTGPPKQQDPRLKNIQKR